MGGLWDGLGTHVDLQDGSSSDVRSRSHGTEPDLVESVSSGDGKDRVPSQRTPSISPPPSRTKSPVPTSIPCAQPTILDPDDDDPFDLFLPTDEDTHCTKVPDTPPSLAMSLSAYQEEDIPMENRHTWQQHGQERWAKRSRSLLTARDGPTSDEDRMAQVPSSRERKSRQSTPEARRSKAREEYDISTDAGRGPSRKSPPPDNFKQILEAYKDEMESRARSNLAAMHRELLSATQDMVQSLYDDLGNRVDLANERITEQQKEIDQLRTELKDLRQQYLGYHEKSGGPPSSLPPRSHTNPTSTRTNPAYDRAPDNKILRFNLTCPTTLQDLETTFTNLFGDEVPRDKWRIVPKTSSEDGKVSRGIIQFRGRSDSEAATYAENARLCQKEGFIWEPVYTKDKIRVYISIDQSPKADRLAWATKTMVHLLQKSHTDRSFQFNRFAGLVTIEGTDLLYLNVDNPDAKVQLNWKHNKAEREHIDTYKFDKDFANIENHGRNRGSGIPRPQISTTSDSDPPMPTSQRRKLKKQHQA